MFPWQCCTSPFPTQNESTFKTQKNIAIKFGLLPKNRIIPGALHFMLSQDRDLMSESVTSRSMDYGGQGEFVEIGVRIGVGEDGERKFQNYYQLQQQISIYISTLYTKIKSHNLPHQPIILEFSPNFLPHEKSQLLKIDILSSLLKNLHILGSLKECFIEIIVNMSIKGLRKIVVERCVIGIREDRMEDTVGMERREKREREKIRRREIRVEKEKEKEKERLRSISPQSPLSPSSQKTMSSSPTLPKTLKTQATLSKIPSSIPDTHHIKQSTKIEQPESSIIFKYISKLDSEYREIREVEEEEKKSYQQSYQDEFFMGKA